ncbi:MAG: hypothetical protein K2O61_09630 [Bacteroidaceae bacterium]|nr:hypothetical protein [Bacteroidaceae bacterium]
MAEENISEILGIEEQSAMSSPHPGSIGSAQDNSCENALATIANIVLGVGIVGTLFCLVTLTTTKVIDPTTYHDSVRYDTVFNPGGLAISVGVLFSTITTWALLRVIANISKTLKEINSKMK